VSFHFFILDSHSIEAKALLYESDNSEDDLEDGSPDDPVIINIQDDVHI